MNYQCKLCKKGTNSRKTIREHVRTAHKIHGNRMKNVDGKRIRSEISSAYKNAFRPHGEK